MRSIRFAVYALLVVCAIPSAQATYQQVHVTLPLYDYASGAAVADATHVSVHVYLMNAAGKNLTGDNVLMDDFDLRFNGTTLTSNQLSNGGFEGGNINESLSIGSVWDDENVCTSYTLAATSTGERSGTYAMNWGVANCSSLTGEPHIGIAVDIEDY